MTTPTENTDAETQTNAEPTSPPLTEAAEEALTVPPSAVLPIEALLQLPPPTAPAQPLDPAHLLELAAIGYEEEMAPPEAAELPEVPEQMAETSVNGEMLREALRQTPEALGKLKGLSPRTFAKDTMGRGIDAALEAGGLRTPTRTMEPQ